MLIAKSKKRSEAMKKHWAERRAAKEQHQEEKEIFGVAPNNTYIKSEEDKMYDARQEGYNDGRRDSIDGLLELRDDLARQLKQINLRIAHKEIDLGLK